MIYVVLGMHKSGTSLVASLLHHAGIPMVEGQTDAKSADYESGHKYERRAFRDLNHEILGSENVYSLDIPVPDPVTVSDSLRRSMAGLVADHSAGGTDWGFKDPRTTLTYPIWASVLPEHRLIAVYRPLHELTKRYQADQSFDRALSMVSAWHEHNSRVLAYVEGVTDGSIVISYPELLDGEHELTRLAAFIGRPVPDLRQRGLRRGTGRVAKRVRFAEIVYYLRTRRRTALTEARLDSLRRGPHPADRIPPHRSWEAPRGASSPE